MTLEFHNSTGGGCEIVEGGVSIVEVGWRANELRNVFDDTDSPGEEN